MDRWISDNAASERYPLYTRANAGEVMPDPVSPLMATMSYRRAFEPGWQDAYTRFGTMRPDEIDQDNPCTTGIFGGYLFLNMSMTRLFGVRCPGLTPEGVDLQYFGTMPGIPPYVAKPGDDDPEASASLGAWLQTIMTATDLPALNDLRDEVDELVASGPNLDTATDAELVAWARSLLPMFARVFSTHIETSSACGLGIGTVGGVCEAIGRPELTMTLVAGVGDVDSAAPSWALWDLSRSVASSPELMAAFDAGVDGLYERIVKLGPAGGPFLGAFAAFQDRFGSRGPNEWELRSETWGTHAELPLAAIERLRLRSDADAPGATSANLRARRDDAAAEVRTALAGNPEALGQFEAGLRAALLFSAARERSKTVNIKLVHAQRLALRELGRRMAERGHLEHPAAIFMLADDELDRFLGEPGAFVDTIPAREREYLRLFELEPPFVFCAPPPPVSTWRRRDEGRAEVAAPGTVLTGIAGCAGIVRGRARIVHDPADPGELDPGDILVAPSTDPSWTPLFMVAGGVVVNVGAQITHAVIVSRELGIPCVVSVLGATDVIPSGAEIEVDGTAGTVTLL